MADSEHRRPKPVRETTKPGEKRRNPRFPNSSIWSEERRLEHREERDSALEGAGLVTDRMLGPDGEPPAGESMDVDPEPADSGKAGGN